MKELRKSILLVGCYLMIWALLFCAVALPPLQSPAPSMPGATQPATVPPVTTTAPTVPTTTAPTTTVPTTTVPTTTVPPTTVPPTTIPETTVPPTTVPPTTVPPTTVPPTTVPPTTVPVTTVPPTTVPDDGLDARNAFVYDCGADRLLFQKGDMTTRLHPASITKLFTVYVALQYLEPDRPITAGKILNTVPIDSSFAGLKIGDVLTTEQLVAAMLLPSGNDAAKVMAVEAGRVIAGKPKLSEKAAQAAFIDEMNRQVKILGLQDSHFSCPDGYNDKDHYTCMADLLTITRLCLDIPLVRQVAAMPTYKLTLPNGRTLSWRNTNMLVWEDSPYYSPYAIGLKTGFTNAAGNCLISAFHIDGRDVIVAVFGCSEIRARFEDTLTLFNEYT